MRRGTRFFIGLAAAIITYASLTAFAGSGYPVGPQYDNYNYGGWHPYRPYRQQPPYPPQDSFYNRPYSPDRHQ